MEDRIRGGASGEQLRDEWAQSEARDLADAARQQLDEIRHEATARAAKAKQHVQGAMQQTREHLEDTVQRVRKHPITALLIAVGAVLVLGWLGAAARR